MSPTTQLTVDPMHCLLEGIVEKHFREVLKLTTTRQRTVATPQPAIAHQFRALPDNITAWSEVDKKHVPELHKILLGPLEEDGKESLIKKLSRRNMKPLVFVCEGLNIKPSVEGRKLLKSDWAETLADWVSHHFHS